MCFFSLEQKNMSPPEKKNIHSNQKGNDCQCKTFEQLELQGQS